MGQQIKLLVNGFRGDGSGTKGLFQERLSLVSAVVMRISESGGNTTGESRSGGCPFNQITLTVEANDIVPGRHHLDKVATIGVRGDLAIVSAGGDRDDPGVGGGISGRCHG